MATKKESQELTERIFRAEFDKYKNPWEQESAKEVIEAVICNNMRPEFIQEMQDDL